MSGLQEHLAADEQCVEGVQPPPGALDAAPSSAVSSARDSAVTAGVGQAPAPASGRQLQAQDLLEKVRKWD